MSLSHREQNHALIGMMSRRWVTPAQARQDIGCIRLAARVYDIKGMGLEVRGQMRVVDGEPMKAYFIPRQTAERVRQAVGDLSEADQLFAGPISSLASQHPWGDDEPPLPGVAVADAPGAARARRSSSGTKTLTINAN